MINLPNDCSCSNLSVYPKNWKSKNAKISVDWYIMYRFYDPNYPKPKQVVVKGMNRFITVMERQEATKKAFAEELDKLINKGFNPFFKPSKIAGLRKEIGSVQENFLTALQFASERIKVSSITLRDIKSMLASVSKSIKVLGLQNLPVSQITRRDIKHILEAASTSSDRFNKNRSYLMILFSELCELELVENNPVRDIKKKRTVKRIREVLSNAERKLVNDYLLNNYPEFHRFLHIFFHSGARISELLRVKTSDVDMENQRYKMIIQKGRQYKEVWRTIKDIVVPAWRELQMQAGKDDFLFSRGLKPGIFQIQAYQVTKRWYRLVKKKLNIKADFYSLKHLHTTEVIDLLNEKEAAKHNEHASTAMVVGIYDVKRNERTHSKVKELNNKFA